MLGLSDVVVVFSRLRKAGIEDMQIILDWGRVIKMPLLS